MGSKSPPYEDVIMWVPFQNALLFYCTLCTNSRSSSINAVVRHVNLAQITYYNKQIKHNKVQKQMVMGGLKN